MQQPFRVGIIGLQPGESWGAVAHLPALRALPGEFMLAGVANSSTESAARAAAECGVPRAFPDIAALVASPDIDIVTVAVKVPHHHALVSAALAAGKHVYCEWPLGNGLAEAEDLAGQAEANGVLAVVGTQARRAPEMAQVARLVAEGYVGRVLSSTLVASGLAWGAEVQRRNAYLVDRPNGATMLTIPFGHTLAAVQDVLGRVVEVAAMLRVGRAEVVVSETGERLTMTSPDQVLVQGLLAGGAPIAIHYRGGVPGGTGLLWEIEGTEGDIRVSGPGGHSQLVPLTVEGRQGAAPLAPLPLDPATTTGWPADPVARNVALVYAAMAADLREGTRTAPSFADAVTLHRLIDAIEQADRSGCRVAVEA